MRSMIKLPTRSVEKPWGRDSLPAPFCSQQRRRIGEIWFEPPEDFAALLVKYIFTSEKLSVQVHPSDAHAAIMGPGVVGKEECWLILDAEPDATLGIGFTESISPDDMRAVALDGSIERRMAWHRVEAGDFFYIPAGTVHAIGAGVSLIEVQQNSDTTFRLYDYARPRELHLDEAIAVARGEPFDSALRRKVAVDADAMLVNGPVFRLVQSRGLPGAEQRALFPGPLLVIPRTGTVSVAGTTIAPGECGQASSIDAVSFNDDATCLLAAPVS